MKASDALDAAIWAMDEEWLMRLRAIALGDGEGPEAVAAKLGRPLQNAQDVRVRDGIAVIPIVGPIFRYANVFTQVSGATSIEIFARDLRVALDDPSIRGIVLEINSPGGQVDGVNEAAEMIAAADKPTVAYVSGMGTSAAYWLASAADRLVIDATARLGSIGVVVAIDRDRKAKEGVIEIVSSQSPMKRPDVNTPEGRGAIQAQVDAIADVFVDAVARFRDVDRATVLSEFGGGSVKVGTQAIEAQMADSEGSLERTIAQLAAGQMPPKQRRRKSMAANDTTEKTYTEAEFKAAIDKSLDEGMKLGLEEGRKNGLADGAKAERDRILGIEAVALPGHEKLVADFKADGVTTAGEAAIKITEAEKLTRERRIDAIRRDANATVIPAAPSVTGDVPATGADDPNRPLEERAKAAWDATPTLRDEFSDNFEFYLAWRKADARGHARILRVVGQNA